VADPQVLTSRQPVAEAARRVASAVAEADAAVGSARWAIPGGSALAAVGRARRELEPAVWSRVRLTWVDERCVAPDHPASNVGAAYRQGSLERSVPPAEELPLLLAGESPDEARSRVEAGLRERFGGGLDVVLLGLGEDGHVASLFPGHPVLQATGLVEIVRDSPKPPPARLTLTLPLLKAARATVILALGEAKRGALLRLLRGDPGVPAAALPNLTIVTDLKLR
jgi:6-phosphogluconolactonase